ncbi:GH-E family nuclease [Lactiplantibacillus plantarum]|nr:GH-E family nuclease [Lactiplantibacillus plantarum]
MEAGLTPKRKVDFGHLPGKSYKEMFNLYKNRKMTLKDFQFNPKNSRLETPSANRSHKYETR